MTAATTIITYLGEGTHAARPAAPNVPTGGLAFYYETDTSTLFFYNVAGPAWVAVGTAGGGASALLDTLGSTQGDILYRGASAWAVLAPGTSGQVLTTQGAAANPHWAAGGGGGGGVLTVPVQQKTGNYTLLSTDLGNLLEWEDLNAVRTITLPDPGVSFFPANSTVFFQNNGTNSPLVLTPTTAVINGGVTATLVLGDNMGCLLISDGTNWYAIFTAPIGGIQTLKTGAKTATGTNVMAGLGAAGATLSPKRTGNILATFCFDISNGAGVGNSAAVSIRYGTGTPPAGGAAATGTQPGSTHIFQASTTTGADITSLTFAINGLTLGTTYWFDLAFSNNGTSGTVTLANNDVSLVEL